MSAVLWRRVVKLQRIESKLDYGCMVYGSTSSSYTEQLEPIQNNAFRLCLGAFRSSPVDSLHVEANILPLSYRRQKIALQYVIKLKSHQIIHPMIVYFQLIKSMENAEK